MSNHDTLLVVDIETVRDQNVLPAEWPDDKWPPAIGWKVVTLGMMVVSIMSENGQEKFEIQAVRSGVGDEHKLINTFWSYIDKHSPKIVTWNGRTFDLPVLQQRAFIHAVPMPGYFQSGQRWENYRHRYSDEWHCDLMDVMANQGATKSTKLDMMASAIGLPGKIGACGSEVQSLYEAGQIERIRSYCECDLLNLYGLYIRWCLVTGRIGIEAHDTAFSDLASYLEKGKAMKPHFAEFLDRWDSHQIAA
jgi:3'-5' exonuclease